MQSINEASQISIDRWRKSGIKVFIHVDDSFGIVKGRDEAVRVSNRIRRDLALYGLLALEKKLEWGARRSVV